MEEQQRNIDDVFRQSLADYREAPPGVVWKNIASRLDEEDDRRRRGGFFMRWPWIALSLALLVSGAWVVTGLNNNGDGSAVQKAHIASGNTSQGVSAAGPSLNQGNTVPMVQHSKAMSTKATHHVLGSAHSKTVSPANVQAPTKSSREPAVNTEELSEETVAVQESNHSEGAAAVEMSFVPATHKKEKPVTRLLAKHERAVAVPDVKIDHPKPVKVDMATSLPARENFAAPEKAPAEAAQSTAWTKPEAKDFAKLEGAKSAQAIKPQPAKTPEMLAANSNTLPAIDLPKEDKKQDSAPSSSDDASAAQTDQQEKTEKAPLDKDPQKQASAPVVDSSTDTQPDYKVPDLVSQKPVLPISLAVMAGYEHSFNSPAQKRFDAAARLLWHASRTIAFGIQPAFRFGNIPMSILSQPGIYQRSSIQIDSFNTVDVSPSVYGGRDTIHNYVIRETFDSIFVKAASVGGSFWELELPLIVHLSLSKAWSVYGGPSISFGGKLPYSTAGDPQIITHIRKDSLAQSQALPAAAFNHYFGKSSLESYSAYKPQPAVDPASVRLGYLVGIGYGRNRLMADLSLHQQMSGYKDVPQPMRDAFAKPTVRISVGYLLFVPGKR